jgi:hypothetical protein
MHIGRGTLLPKISTRINNKTKKNKIMNRDKHIWEGWTVGDFIDDVEFAFDRCAPFQDKKSLKRWVTQNQPYYKKHIPEVYRYFLKKSGL